MLKYVVSLIAVIGLAGCSVPDQAQIDNTDIGPYPGNYESLVKSEIEDSLIDPYSARYKMGSPVRGWAGRNVGTKEIGWVVTGTVNAKNRFGGYVGAEKFFAVIRHGQVVHVFYERPQR
jgi:hypothetical protein